MPGARTADVVVIGAGIVGAACAYYAARAGLRVAVVDRGPLSGGTTGAGEGNILVSDKAPGPELDLILHSRALWLELSAFLPDSIELEPKGGLVVASSEAALAGLRDFGETQAAAGVEVTEVAADDLRDHEPQLADDLAGGALYPQDMQVQPMRATAHLLRAAVVEHGASLRPHETVIGVERGANDRVHAVQTSAGRIAAPAVVNAAGTWSPEIARLAGSALPILPRRGFILVTEALPPLIRHKVYAADYVANVADGATEGALTSPVVEGTRAGTILIGSSRERVGFDHTPSLPVLRRLAAQAIALFPFLAGVHALRAYHGFRPYSPDHLPVIGADPRAPGLFHATGHEGAGIGLAPATGHLIAALLTGAEPVVDPAPVRPDRFETDGHG